MKKRTGLDIIRAASETTDRPRTDETIFNTVNDLLFRVTDQSKEKAALIEAQSILKEKLGVRHAAVPKECGDAARLVLSGLLA